MEVTRRNTITENYQGNLISSLKPGNPEFSRAISSLNSSDSLNLNPANIGVNKMATVFSKKVLIGVRTDKKYSEIKKPIEIKDFKIDDQGYTNACGTTSLVSVLKYHGSPLKDHWEVDKSIRSTRFDMFTAPGDVVSFARSKGFNAGLKNNGTYEELAGFIDKGIPLMTLIDSGSENDFYMHWVVITGYERDDAGKISNLRIADPGGGYIKTLSTEDFDKDWKNVKVGYENMKFLGTDTYRTGYNRMYIAIAPKNKNIVTPEGKTINTGSIGLPKDSDTVQGYGAQLVAKASRLIDKTISLGEKITGITKNSA